MNRWGSGIRLWVEWWLVLLLAIMLLAGLVVTGSTERLDNAAYDWLVRAVPRRIDPRIVVVAIDDRSLQAEGRWPWSRQRDAALLRAIAMARPKAIGLDILLPPGDAAEDAVLAAAMNAGAPVFLPVHFVVPGRNGSDFDLEMPAPVLRNAAAGLGQVNLAFDGDGNVRRTYLTYVGRQRAWDHLAVLIAGQRRSVRDNPVVAAGILAARDPVMVGYVGPQGTFPTISASSLLRGEVPPEMLRDRLVLVGATAAGLGDAYATPFSDDASLMPGVEIQANLLNMLLTGERTTLLPRMTILLVSIVPIVLLHLAMRAWSPGRSLPLAVGLIAAVALASGLMLTLAHVWFPPVAALICTAAIYPVWMWRRLTVVSGYMLAELKKLDGERDPLERARPDLSRADFVEHQMGLLQSAIDRERDMRRFLKDRVAQMPDAVVVTDADGMVVLANHRAERLMHDLTGAQRFDRVDTLLAELRPLTGMGALPLPKTWPEAPFPCGFQVDVADGRTFDVQFEPQYSEDGAPLGMVIRLVDMTMATRLQRQREDVLQLLSHDLRAPSASIMALIDSATKDGGVATALPKLRAHAERTLAIADDFVHLARAELKAADMRPVDLVEIAHVAADSLWPRASEKQVAIELAIEPEDVWVSGEEAMLVRLVVNLLDNAIKFSSAGQKVQLSVTTSAGLVQCIVADNGPGIASDQLDAIFEKFTSAPAGPFRNLGGTGLGLAFVHTVATRHRGRIVCDSVVGEGTRFTLEMPVLPVADQPVEV